MERKLATIQRIREIRPIEGADAIELAMIEPFFRLICVEVNSVKNKKSVKHSLMGFENFLIS
jgi:hypothetical protein